VNIAPGFLLTVGVDSLINRQVNDHFESDKAFGPLALPWALLAQVLVVADFPSTLSRTTKLGVAKKMVFYHRMLAR
jgi:hypothetical protein